MSSYMNCPRCGLTLGLRAPFLALERCPRCLARAGAAIPMYLSDQPPAAPAKRPSRQVVALPSDVASLAPQASSHPAAAESPRGVVAVGDAPSSPDAVPPAVALPPEQNEPRFITAGATEDHAGGSCPAPDRAC
jgi:hypothetical protein